MIRSEIIGLMLAVDKKEEELAKQVIDSYSSRNGFDIRVEVIEYNGLSQLIIYDIITLKTFLAILDDLKHLEIKVY